MRNPELHPTFRTFFTKSWFESLNHSLHNFLTVIFQSIPLPKLLNFNVERVTKKALKSQVDALTFEGSSI